MTTTVYGASDDLVEVEGAVREEFSAYEGARIGFDSGDVLALVYDGDGIWRITVEAGTATVVKCEDREGFTDADGPIYSDLATVTGATSVEELGS